MEPIAKVFSQLLWRSSKKDVAVEVSPAHLMQCSIRN